MGNTFTTVPGSIPGSPLEPIIWNEALAAAGLTSVAAVTLATAPATGTYRLTLMADLTAVGAGTGTAATTVAVSVVYQDPNAAASQTASSVVTFSTDSASNYNGTLGNVSVSAGAQSFTFRALAGTAIQALTTYTRGGGLTTGPKVQVFAILESLGQ